jgi:4-amino-4-deoxy-L-arabinose transferase-like glycosyltransferase
VLYFYGRSCLSRLGAFAAALIFASMGQVLELGRQGETDAIFTLFTGGSLLAFKTCRNRNVSPRVTWPLCYTLVACGLLTKGPQAPLYFVCGVWGYLLVTRRWRELLTPAHLLGLICGAAVTAIWQVPYAMHYGAAESFRVYIGDVGARFEDMRPAVIVKHLVSFPLELLFGSMMPWSVLLIAYANRDFRRQLGRSRDEVLFLTVCIATTFPSVWIRTAALGVGDLSRVFALVGIHVGRNSGVRRIRLDGRDQSAGFIVLSRTADGDSVCRRDRGGDRDHCRISNRTGREPHRELPGCHRTGDRPGLFDDFR